VPIPTPSFSEIVRQEAPEARSEAVLGHPQQLVSGHRFSDAENFKIKPPLQGLCAGLAPCH
jgi:hypothetical protein